MQETPIVIPQAESIADPDDGVRVFGGSHMFYSDECTYLEQCKRSVIFLINFQTTFWSVTFKKE